MLSKDHATAVEVEKVMKQIYEKLGIAYHTYVTMINQKGVEII